MTHPPSSLVRAQLPPVPNRTLTDEQYAWLRRQHESLPQPPNRQPVQCVTCSGRRSIRWWADEGRSEIVEYDCPCADQWVLHMLLTYAGVGKAYQRLSWADFIDLPPGIQPALDYLDKIEEYSRVGLGLLLWGDAGTGKTMLAELMTKDLFCRRGIDALSITFAGLLQAYSGGWRDADLKRWFDARLRNAGLLLVNDVGREHQGGRTIADSTLEDVLRHRAEYSLPTIITTNLRPRGTERSLAAHYGPNTASLLTETMIEVEFRGTDQRRAVKDRLREEIQRGLTRPLVVG